MIAGGAEAAQCGSALLFETDSHAVFDGFDPAAQSSARFWEAGWAGSNLGDLGCVAGCVATTGALCASGGDCLAIGGVSWLNAACSVPGHLPARTVFVVEQTTQGSGGRWAAINLDRNSDNANTDLDAKAATVCGGCASTLSPYLGGGGRPVVTGSSVSGGDLVVDLTWAAPPAAAQALSNGSDLVTGYGIFYRTFATTPLPATGDATGWVPAADQEADGALMDGYSSDTSASLRIPLVGLSDSISIALGLNFDGSGNPVADANTMVSTYLSDDTDPIPVPTACGESNDLLLESQTISDTQEFVACLSITSGNGFTIGTTGTVTFRAGEIIVLRNGFTVESGGSFSAEVDTSLSP